MAEKRPIRVLIVDDHAVVRSGLSAFLLIYDDLELVGEAMWCRPAEDKPGYWVGLELKDSSRDDMEKWCKVVHTLSN